MASFVNRIEFLGKMSDDELRELIPGPRYRWLNYIGKSLTNVAPFAYKDDRGRVIAICLYIIQSAMYDRATFIFIEVDEDYRDSGLAISLFKGSMEMLKDWGYKYITASSIVDMEDNSLLRKLGFRFQRKEYYMVYKAADIRASKLGSHSDQLLPIIKYVKKIDELSETARKDFSDLMMSGFYHIDISKCDPNLTRYFIGPKGKVIGYMPLRISSNGDIMNLELYILPCKESIFALPAMLLDVLITDAADINDDSNIIVSMAAEDNVKAMKIGFGEPTLNRSIEVFSYDL